MFTNPFINNIFSKSLSIFVGFGIMLSICMVCISAIFSHTAYANEGTLSVSKQQDYASSPIIVNDTPLTSIERMTPEPEQSEIASDDLSIPTYQDNQQENQDWQKTEDTTVDEKKLQLISKISVVVDGNISALLEKNLKASLADITEAEFSRYQKALPRIKQLATEASEAVGYYKVSFIFTKLNFNTLYIEIEQKSPVIITQSNIQILKNKYSTDDESLHIFDDLLKNNMLKVNTPFNHQHYKDFKESILNQAKEMGYIDAKWQRAKVEIIMPDNTAEIDMVFYTGQRYKFGKVFLLDKNGTFYHDINQVNDIEQIKVDKKLIMTLRTFEKGDFFAQQQLDEYRNLLLATQYFNFVDIQTISDPKMLTENQTVNTVSGGGQTRQKYSSTVQQQLNDLKEKMPYQLPVVIVLNNTKPNNAQFGFGYGTNTGLRLRSKINRDLINAKGHSIAVDVEASLNNQAVEITYERPFKSPLRDTVTYFSGVEHESREVGVGELDILQLTFGIQRDRRMGKWHKSFSLKYFLDELDTKNVEQNLIDDLPTQFTTGSDRVQLLLLGVGFNRSYFKGGLHPTDGVKKYVQAQVGFEKVLSDVSLGIVRTGLSAMRSYGENDIHQFVASVDLASIITNNFDKVPYNQRFFAGGDRSIRGYNYKSLTPQNADGFLQGGQHLAVGSAEYSLALNPQLRFAGFTDFGNAFDGKFNNPVKVGAGLGIRWLSPVGLVRLDVAAGVSEENPPIRLHFFIGPPL